MHHKIEYPNGAEFAFTILDDTDDTTLANGRPVYLLLKDAGMRTTKTVWAIDTPPENRGIYFAGETLSGPGYLEWVHQLSQEGFEIAFHNATMSSSTRDETIRALNLLDNEFGKSVRLHCNHGQNRENLFWGAERYGSPLLRSVMKYIERSRHSPVYEGHIPTSDYYWSDVVEERISYMRGFAFNRLNGMKIPPYKPYKDPAKLNNPVFFNTADAPQINAFNKLVNRKSIDKLRKEGGWAIVSTHIGKGFFQDGRVNKDFQDTIEYMATLRGWYVPVSELLDYICINTNVVALGRSKRWLMEYSHVLDRALQRIFTA